MKVETIKALVGKNISNVYLDGKGGTKHAVTGNQGGIKSLPLGELIPNALDVKILKSDADGFDYDVLDSSMSVIQTYKPIIFCECYYDSDYQKSGYSDTIKNLESAGYCDWTIFDNFGEVVIRTNDIDVISQLINYVWRQNAGHTTRTIYYFDILSVQKTDSFFY